MRAIWSVALVALASVASGCASEPAYASPLSLAQETRQVVQDIQQTEQVVFNTLDLNLNKVQALSNGLREGSTQPLDRDEVVSVLQEVTESIEGLSHRKGDFEERVRGKLAHLQELEGQASSAIEDVRQRRAELEQQYENPGSDDPIVVAARREAFAQAGRYVEEQIKIWNQFVDTHSAIQDELGEINRRIDAFLAVTDATAVVYREALNLIPSQKPVLRKFQRFSTCERYRMLG